MGVPVMVIALAALGLLISGLVSLLHKAQLFRVPLAERQEVSFAEAGHVVLNHEGLQGATQFEPGKRPAQKPVPPFAFARRLSRTHPRPKGE
jgi:hypothetical protein